MLSPKGPVTAGIGRNERRGRTTSLFGLGLGCLRLGLCSPKGPATTGISRNERRGRTTTRACQTNPILGRGSIRLNVAQKRPKWFWETHHLIFSCSVMIPKGTRHKQCFNYVKWITVARFDWFSYCIDIFIAYLIKRFKMKHWPEFQSKTLQRAEIQWTKLLQNYKGLSNTL